MSGKTAIVLPIYNQEKYLAKALDSLLAQTCGDWVAFCVNDGSMDATADILADYAGRDHRFVVITQENAGVGAARNAGLEAALALANVVSVSFVDPDDFLHPQCLEVARKALARHPGAVVEWDIRRMDESAFYAARYDGDSIVEKRGLSCHSIWNKLYPIGVLRDVRSYPPARIAQDLAFVLELMHREKPEVWHVAAVLYYYVENPSSTVHRRLKPSDFERISVVVEYIVRIHEDDPRALDWLGHRFLPSLLKRFFRDFRRVDHADLADCKRIFGREIAALRARGLLHPLRGSIKDLKYYFRFLWLAHKYGGAQP